jgi:hypothetical protein
MEAAKKSEAVHFYVRPTIEWALSCESEPGLDRSSIISLLDTSVSMDDDPGNYYLRAIFGCLIGLFNSFCIMAVVKGGESNPLALIPTILSLVCTVAGGFAVMFMLSDASDS